jgi:subtilisin family serine protease
VGDIDTGLDSKHPDLTPSIDVANNASCIGGGPDQSHAAWDDRNGHGAQTAGTIAAASNQLVTVAEPGDTERGPGIRTSTAPSLSVAVAYPTTRTPLAGKYLMG